ncbi:hypothetical protein HAX54_040312, partial [Datura stramonium]|nr:hypothetical protein [Datura stramonium]
MNLTWDLKFLFLVEVGDPFLAVGNLCGVAPSKVVSPVLRCVCHYTEEAVPRACQHAGEGPRRACPRAGIRPCRACQRAGKLGASHLPTRREAGRLAPGHAPLLLRFPCLVAP